MKLFPRININLFMSVCCSTTGQRQKRRRRSGQLLSFVVTVSRAHILSHLMPSRIHSHFGFVFFRTLKILHKHRLHTQCQPLANTVLLTTSTLFLPIAVATCTQYVRLLHAVCVYLIPSSYDPLSLSLAIQYSRATHIVAVRTAMGSTAMDRWYGMCSCWHAPIRYFVATL